MTRVKVRGEGLERAQAGSGVVYRKWVVTPGPLPAGMLVELVDDIGSPIACGLWEPEGPVAIRVLSEGKCHWSSAWEALEDKLESALKLRERLGPLYSRSFRLVNSDGDRLSGLIVDYYDSVAVIQSSSYAIDAHVGEIAGWLHRELGAAVYEKSTQRSRRDIGLPPRTRWLVGRAESVIVEEAGVRFIVDVVHGQKTGFYLDQRLNRIEFARYAGPSDRVLDVFSYTGGFALHALHAGAREAVLVEEDPWAARIALDNARLNGVDNRVRIVVGSVWERMDEAGRGFTLAAVDPPAFIQSGEAEARRRGKRAYWRAYISSLGLLEEGSIAYLSSCSYFLARSEFLGLIASAARASGFASYRILGSLRGAGPDHTLRGEEYLDYLKGAFLLLST